MEDFLFFYLAKKYHFISKDIITAPCSFNSDYNQKERNTIIQEIKKYKNI